MGGLWLHPIKLLDGFWLRLHDLDSDNVDVWTIADAFENHPEGNVFYYKGNLGHTPVQLTRTQIIPEAEPGVPGSGGALLVDYCLFNTSAAPRRIDLEFLAHTDLQPVWYSREQGIADEDDEGSWLAGEELFLAKDTGHEWYAAIGSIPAPAAVLSSAEAEGKLWAPSAETQRLLIPAGRHEIIVQYDR
ncbi:hypothetical protein FACS1894147_10590 [Spirochaetia bacterium]|nr:hypothetical protein FACS1894147_10590 [Spirochaetia bacterium]